jgi:hypothetical protein
LLLLFCQQINPGRVKVVRNAFGSHSKNTSDKLASHTGKKALQTAPERIFMNDKTRLKIRETCDLFIELGYNPLMTSVLGGLHDSNRFDAADYEFFMKLGAFMMGYHRLKLKR